MTNTITPKLSLKTVLLRWETPAFCLCVIFFLLWPNLDLALAGKYFDTDSGFYYNDYAIVQFIYKVFAKIHILYLLIFIGAIIYFSRTNNLKIRKYFVFLLTTLLLGPGILVNITLKDNSVGRPRPQHIEQFGGEMVYTPVFHYSGECRKNCSFVSGHASIGFYLFALAWVRRNKAWLFYGAFLGALVGYTRIVQGGHFLSDVIFAGWATYFVCAISAHFMGMSLSKVEKEGTET